MFIFMNIKMLGKQNKPWAQWEFLTVNFTNMFSCCVMMVIISKSNLTGRP